MPDRTRRVVVVTSATGRQGGATARRLMAGGFHVRAFVRDPGSVPARLLHEAGAELVVGDMDDRDSLDAAMRGAYGVFSLQPSMIPPLFAPNELQRGLNVANAAHAAVVRHLVYVSVAGADGNPGIPHWEAKRQVEEHVRRIGIPSTVLRPTMFMDNYADATNGLMSDYSVLRMIPPNTIVQHIAIDDIGAFAALAFATPSYYVGKAIELAGDELTLDDLLAALRRTVRLPIPGSPGPIAWADYSATNSSRTRHRQGLARFGGWRADIGALRALHPGLMTFDEWLAHGGAVKIEESLRRYSGSH